MDTRQVCQIEMIVNQLQIYLNKLLSTYKSHDQFTLILGTGHTTWNVVNHEFDDPLS